MDSKIDEHKLKCSLKEYIESQRKYNDICMMAEEYDFQGLVEYITQELLDDIEQRFFSVSKAARRKAHEEIISKAVIYSKASTDESKKRVGRLVAISLEIVHQFFKKRILIADYLIAVEIIDAVDKNTSQAVKSAATDIQQTVLENKNGFDKAVNSKWLFIFSRKYVSNGSNEPLLTD